MQIPHLTFIKKPNLKGPQSSRMVGRVHPLFTFQNFSGNFSGRHFSEKLWNIYFKGFFRNLKFHFSELFRSFSDHISYRGAPQKTVSAKCFNLLLKSIAISNSVWNFLCTRLAKPSFTHSTEVLVRMATSILHNSDCHSPSSALFASTSSNNFWFHQTCSLILEQHRKA